MVISNSQLETWSHQGAIQGSQATHQSIRTCLSQYQFPEGIDYCVYLQGSYKNSTNIYANSDVDVIVQLDSTLKSDLRELNERQKEIHAIKYSKATYLLSDFKADVLKALRNYYDSSKISVGNKAISLEGYSGRLNADIITCVQFRYFWDVSEHSSDRYTQGIAFQTASNNWINSYPNQHYDNGITKMSNTSQKYKSTIRIYKNLKVRMIKNSYIPDSLCTSYYLECLLHNSPDRHFSGDFYDRTLNTLKWLNENNDGFVNFKHQHNLYDLFGPGADRWDSKSAIEFVDQVVEFWNDWE